MAGSFNRVLLVGNLGKDPESRTLQSGGKVVSFSIATSESWTDRASGERKERTQWHRIVVFNEQLADIAERFLAKGRKVLVEGQMETRKYTDQAGAEREITEVVMRPYRGVITILDTQHRDGDGPPAREPAPQRQAASTGGGTRAAAPSRQPNWDAPRRGNDLDDDSIPF